MARRSFNRIKSPVLPKNLGRVLRTKEREEEATRQAAKSKGISFGEAAQMRTGTSDIIARRRSTGRRSGRASSPVPFTPPTQINAPDFPAPPPTQIHAPVKRRLSEGVSTPPQEVISADTPSFNLGTLLEDRFGSQISIAEGGISAAQKALKTAQQEEEKALREARERAITPSRFDEQQLDVFRQQRSQQIKESGIQAALMGTARGTRAAERKQLMEETFKMQGMALEAEQTARRKLVLAQVEGASRQRLEDLQKRLNLSVEQRLGLEEQINKFAFDALQEQEQRAFEQQQTISEREFELFRDELKFERESFKDRQQLIFDQIELAGPNFVESLSESQQREIEQAAGFTPGFLSAAAKNLTKNEDPTNEFTFTAPKIDEFGQIVTPGYIFDKKNGVLNMVDPGTGNVAPVAGADSAYVFKGFEEYASRIGNGSVVSGSPYHKSFEVDIDGKIGDPILAFVGGRVVEAGDAGGFGNSVVVEAPDGTRVRYAHLDSIGVKPGQVLPAGSYLGAMGNTGNVVPMGGGDGSHLHIEARDSTGKLVPLQQIKTQNIIQTSGAPVNLLRAEAISRGYYSADDQQAYVLAKKSGTELPDRINSLLPKERFEMAVSLGKEFETETKAITSTLGQVDRMNAAFDALMADVEQNNDFTKLNQASQAIIIGFNKLLDPGSVVRESEYNRVGEGQSYVDSWKGKLQNWVDGGAGITPENLEEFINVTNLWVDGFKSDFRSRGDRYRHIAESGGLDESIIFTPKAMGIIDDIPQSDYIDIGVQFYSGGELPGSVDIDSVWDSL